MKSHPSKMPPIGMSPIQRNPRAWTGVGWSHFARLYDGRQLLVETVHKGESSMDIEVSAMQRRIDRHEATRIESGPIPA